MSELKRVFVQIGPSHVAEGFYTVRRGVLSMEGCGPDGNPVTWEDGTPITHKLRPNDNPDSIARILTRKIRKMFLGERVPGFNRIIEYSNAGEQMQHGAGFDRALAYSDWKY